MHITVEGMLVVNSKRDDYIHAYGVSENYPMNNNMRGKLSFQSTKSGCILAVSAAGLQGRGCHQDIMIIYFSPRHRE